MIVHQMGKVGSTTVVHSLKAAGVDKHMTIYQTHYLSEDGLEFYSDLQVQGYGGWENMPPKTKQSLMRHKVLRQRLRAGYLDRHDTVLVTLVRDPIATNLSGYFHNYRWWPDDLRMRCESMSPDGTKLCSSIFWRPIRTLSLQSGLIWEMNAVFGIDVFQTEFDHRLGFSIVESNSTPLLILKVEDLDASLAPAFRKFLGIDSLNLVRTNEAEQKVYASLYSTFIRSLQLPVGYVSRLYDSRYARHFYSSTDIDLFTKRWIGSAVSV